MFGHLLKSRKSIFAAPNSRESKKGILSKNNKITTFGKRDLDFDDDFDYGDFDVDDDYDYGDEDES